MVFTILFKPRQVDYNEVDKIILVCVHLDKNSTRGQILLIDKNFKESIEEIYPRIIRLR